MGIVVIEGDMLVQPRMYKDNGFELPDIDQDGDPEGSILDDAASGSMAVKDDEEFTENNGAENGTEKGTQKGTEKVQRKAPVSHAGASHAEFEIENINNNSIKGNIGGVGDKMPDKKKADSVQKSGVKQKNTKFSPPTLEEVQAYCQEKQYTFDAVMFWNHYEANGWVQGEGKPIKSWQACCNTWQRRESNGEFRNNNNNGNNGRQATTTNQRGAYQGAGRNQEQEAAALREQTVRLIERNRAQRAAAQADGTDTGDDPF